MIPIILNNMFNGHSEIYFGEVEARISKVQGFITQSLFFIKYKNEVIIRSLNTISISP